MSSVPRLALATMACLCVTDVPRLRAESPDGTTSKRRAVLELDFGALFGGADSEAAIAAREEEDAEGRLLADLRKTVPYRQAAVIRLEQAGGSILGFCVLPHGELVVISGPPEGFGTGVLTALFGGGTKAQPSRVHWLDADGTVRRSTDLDFKPKAVTAAADGSVFVVGDGTIARFDARGKQEVQVQSPHLAHVVTDRERFAADVVERHREEIAQLEEQAAQYAETQQELEARDQPDAAGDLAEARMLTGYFAKQLETMRALSEETVVKQALQRLREIHRVAVTKDNVFVVTSESSGHGYCLWRMTHRLDDARKIVGKLAGCCGQMDVQALGDRLVVAENSRHRVLILDEEGKTIEQFGESNRTDVTKGFGGCCNPMNTCPGEDGCLLTSESNGIVKRYSQAGEFQEVIGVADIVSGCKNSAIGMARDGSRLYYFDVIEGRILVLRKKS